MDLYNALPWNILLLLIVIAIWETVWKAIGLWKSAKHNQLAWFVVLVIFNTAGILPLIYLAFFQKKAKKEMRVTLVKPVVKKKVAKKKTTKKK